METPECDKLAAKQDEREAITNFIEYIEERGLRLCTCKSNEPWDPQYYPINERNDSFIMKYLGVDEKKLESERRAILDECRNR